MNIAIIGEGAIGRYVIERLPPMGHTVRAIIKRADSIDALPDDVDHVVDCAGHAALRAHGPAVLRRGLDLTTVSIGALADETLHDELARAATEGGSKLHLVSGAIGALDCLLAARIESLEQVTYVGRKPPQAWRGSPAEDVLDLDNPGEDAVVHFEGSARLAATRYPKNANVAAAVALAGLGFDDTRVQLIADPGVSQNIHEVHAIGAFGRFQFEIQGNSLPDNPKSSALAAMSVLSKLEQISSKIST